MGAADQATKSSTTTSPAQPWYRSTADNTRLKLFKPSGIVLFTVALIAALVAAYPFQDLATRLAKGGKADLLSVSYLRVWIRTQPDEMDLRVALARQLQAIGKFEEAHQELKIVLASKDKRLRDMGLRLEIDLFRSEAWAMPEGNKRRVELLALADEKYRILVPPKPIAKVPGSSTIFTASQVEERALLIEFATAPPPDADYVWFMKQAKSLLAYSLYRLSADMNWRAFALANTQAQKRQAFDTALATLEGGNLALAAVSEAEQRLGQINVDMALYKRLTKMALGVGRLDAAERYAKLMLKLSMEQSIEQWLLEHLPMREYFEGLRFERVANTDHHEAYVDPIKGRDAEKERSNAQAVKTPFDNEVYKLGFDVFMANRNLADALRVAQSAVRQVPTNLEWLTRLAQVSEWHANPSLSLDTWLTIAKTHSNAEAWKNVKRLATMLNDSERILLVLQHENDSAPSIDKVLEVTKMLEQLGRPKEAYAHLEKSLGKYKGELPLLLKLVSIAVDLEDYALIDQALTAAIQRAPDHLAFAMQKAVFLKERNETKKALELLSSYRGRAEQASTQTLIWEELYYWTLLGNLADELQEDRIAIDAYLMALKHDKIDANQLERLITSAETSNLHLAASAANYAFEKWNNPEYAKRTVAILIQLGSVDLINEYLLRLPAAVKLTFEQDSEFLSQRANLYLLASDYKRARNDVDKAIQLAPNNQSLQVQFMWIALAAKDAPSLRNAARRWEGKARNQEALWAPMAAAWMALSEPQRAAPFFVKQAKRKPDALIYTAYADCLEQLGYVDAAWSLRRRAWLGIRQQPTQITQNRVQAVALALRFAPADNAQKLLRGFLRDAEQQLITSNATNTAFVAPETRPAEVSQKVFSFKAATPSPEVEEVLRSIWLGKATLAHRPIEDTSSAISINSDKSSARDMMLSQFLSQDQSDMARAWLLANYAKGMQRPAWAELSVALAQNDTRSLTRLLDTVSDWLPKMDQIEAMQRSAQPGQAQTLAFAMAEQRPNQREFHDRFRQAALDASSWVSIEYIKGNQSTVDYGGPKLAGLYRLMPSFALNASTSRSTMSSTDQILPSNLKSTENFSNAGFQWLRDGGTVSGNLVQRAAFKTSTGANFNYEQSYGSEFKLNGTLGLHVPTTETPGLRTYGYADEAKLSGRFDITKRETLSAQLGYSRYGIIGEGSIGRSVTLNLEAAHHLRLDYPNVSAKLNLQMRRSSANSNFLPAASVYVNPSQYDLKGLFIPPSSNSFTTGFAYGNTARSGKVAGAWAPYGEFSLSYDSKVGAGYNGGMGFAMSVTGSDKLLVGLTFGSKVNKGQKASKEFNMGYSKQF